MLQDKDDELMMCMNHHESTCADELMSHHESTYLLLIMCIWIAYTTIVFLVYFFNVFTVDLLLF